MTTIDNLCYPAKRIMARQFSVELCFFAIFFGLIAASSETWLKLFVVTRPEYGNVWKSKENMDYGNKNTPETHGKTWNTNETLATFGQPPLSSLSSAPHGDPLGRFQSIAEVLDLQLRRQLRTGPLPQSCGRCENMWKYVNITTGRAGRAQFDPDQVPFILCFFCRSTPWLFLLAETPWIPHFFVEAWKPQILAGWLRWLIRPLRGKFIELHVAEASSRLRKYEVETHAIEMRLFCSTTGLAGGRADTWGWLKLPSGVIKQSNGKIHEHLYQWRFVAGKIIYSIKGFSSKACSRRRSQTATHQNWNLPGHWCCYRRHPWALFPGSMRIKRHPRLKYFECMIRNAGAPGLFRRRFARKNMGDSSWWKLFKGVS